MKIWQPFRRKSEYDFQNLIDGRSREPFSQSQHPHQIICDIDKTYLETEFDSFLDMARIAFEDAEAKITVVGARDVLAGLRWQSVDAAHGPLPLHFVSSSPPQLRAVLEEKLMMDGLDWTSDTFKNQVYNVLQGRMDLLRQHVAYKSGAILSLMQEAHSGTSFFLIGDNAESDPFIYLGVYLFTRGILSNDGYGKYLAIAGIEEKTVQDFHALFPAAPDCRISGILIRNARSDQAGDASILSSPIRFFDNYLQAALIMANAGLCDESLLWPLVRTFHNQHGFSRADICAHLSALVRDTARDSIAEAATRIQERLASIGPLPTQASVAHDLSACQFEAIDQLSEQEVLAFARTWYQDLGAQAKRRGRG